MTTELEKVENVPKTSKKMNKKKYFSPVLCLSLITVGSIQGYSLFFETEAPVMVTSTISYGQLGTALEGSGTASSAEIQTISPSSTGEILAVYVSAGEMIQEGQLLYMQDDSEIDDAILVLTEDIEGHVDNISDYYEVIDGYNDTIADYYDNISDYREDIVDYEEDIYQLREDIKELTVVAPFAGKITDISVKKGDSISSNSTIATLVNNNELSVDLYFSYSYENEISVGDSATISVPDLMLSLKGSVSDIKKVEYITKEGTKCFLVRITVPNGGSLTSGMAVSANIGDMFPVEPGVMENLEEIMVVSPSSGLVEEIYVSNHENVQTGQSLFLMDSTSLEEQISSIYNTISDVEKKIQDEEKNITKVQSSISNQMEKIYEEQGNISEIYSEIAVLEESRADFMVFSEISGKVITVNVKEGETPSMVLPAVLIHNLDTMVFTANIDELDIEHVYIGMPVSVSYSTSGNTKNYEGEITAISYEANNDSGVAYFPVTISTETMGELSSGVNISYKIAVDDSQEGYLVPIDALKTYEDGTCIYIEGSATSEITVEEVPEGYYALDVTVESSDSQNALIRSDSGELSEGMKVFTRYQATEPSNSDVTSAVSGTGTMDMDAMMAMRDSMMASGGMNSGGTTGSGNKNVTRGG